MGNGNRMTIGTTPTNASGGFLHVRMKKPGPARYAIGNRVSGATCKTSHYACSRTAATDSRAGWHDAARAHATLLLWQMTTPAFGRSPGVRFSS